MPAGLRHLIGILAILLLPSLPSVALAEDCVTLPGMNERCAVWSHQYPEGDPAQDTCSDEPAGLVMGRSAVYLTGTTSCSSSNTWDILTMAYGFDGTLLWTARHQGSLSLRHEGYGLALSPDGSTLFVAGSENTGEDDDWIVLAYSAATGEPVWATRYDGNGVGNEDEDQAWAIATSEDGKRVYVTGITRGPTSADGASIDIAIASLDASTGTMDWVERYGHPQGWSDFPRAIGVQGDRVVVTGSSLEVFRQDLVTLAYRDNRQQHRAEPLWADTFDGGDWDQPAIPCLRRQLSICGTMGTIAVTADTVAITATSFVDPTTDDAIWTTIAYDLETGARRWLQHRGDPEYQNKANAIGASPDGETIYVTGFENDELLFDGVGDAVTVAYSADTGVVRWDANEAVPAIDDAAAFNMTATNDTVYVTGAVHYSPTEVPRVDAMVLAYDATTGVRDWIARHNRFELQRAGLGGSDAGNWAGVTPDGSRLIVGGDAANVLRLESQSDYRDFAVLAYDLDSA